jgi:hypothetical protein
VTITADSEFVRLADGHDAECVTCGKHAEVLVIEERRADGSLHGPVYCFVHFAVVAGRAVGIVR